MNESFVFGPSQLTTFGGSVSINKGKKPTDQSITSKQGQETNRPINHLDTQGQETNRPINRLDKQGQETNRPINHL